MFFSGFPISDEMKVCWVCFSNIITILFIDISAEAETPLLWWLTVTMAVAEVDSLVLALYFGSVSTFISRKSDIDTYQVYLSCTMAELDHSVTWILWETESSVPYPITQTVHRLTIARAMISSSGTWWKITRFNAKNKIWFFPYASGSFWDFLALQMLFDKMQRQPIELSHMFHNL